MNICFLKINRLYNAVVRRDYGLPFSQPNPTNRNDGKATGKFACGKLAHYLC